MRNNSSLIVLGMIFLGCFSSLVIAKRYDLKIKGIKCLKENEISEDEMEIKFFEDGSKKAMILWNGVKEGDFYKYPKHFSYDNSFKIEMRELDHGSWIDPHDYIGNFVIDSEEKLKKEKAKVSGDDAVYEVTWENLTEDDSNEDGST